MSTFGSGGKGNSNAKTSSNATTTNTQQTTNNVDNRVVNITSDSGAIQAATDISHDALNLGRSAIDAVGDAAALGLDHAQAAYTSSLTTLGDALNTVGNVALDSNDRVARFASSALDGNNDILSQALGFAENILGSQAKLTDSNIQGLTGLAMQTSQSADDRIVAVIKWVVGGVALSLLASQLLKGAK